MLENQFITIRGGYFYSGSKPILLPTNVYQSGPLYPLYIYIDGGATEISILTESDTSPYYTVLMTKTLEASTSEYKRYDLYDILSHTNTHTALEVGVRYYLRIGIGSGSVTYKFSGSFVFANDTDFRYVRYSCNEDALGFPFLSAGGTYVTMWLPIKMQNPQAVQDDKTYVKANGEVVTLYAKYYKEWECETEFLTEVMHDKIIAALSCDVLYINGTRVTKTDSYKIDWENYDLDCDGVTKLAKATFKVRANVTQRNSNY